MKNSPTVVKKPRQLHFNFQTFSFVIFLLLWTGLSFIASQFIIALPFSLILGDKLLEPLWLCIYDALVYLLTLTLVILVPPQLIKLYRRQHPHKKLPPLTTSPTELGFKQLPTFVDIGLAPVGYAVYLILASAFTAFMQIFPWFISDQTQDVGFSYFITGTDRVIAMIALVFIAPIAEEIIMRGWLYGKLRTKLKIPLAILLTSLLFAILHGQWNVGVSVFALSIVLCLLREITGTIWSGILLHMLSNGIAFYLLYVAI